MAKLKDYIPEVIEAAAKEPGITQTDLSERVWGTSGRGAPALTNTLFPHMVALGYMTATKKGRVIRYTVTQKGVDSREDLIKARGWKIERPPG